jgi:putative CocE/NonD family hydrolase
VIGPLRTDLHLRSTSEHCDVFVRLCDVNPRGRSRNISDGIVRLSSGVETKSSEEIRAIEISMWPTAHTFLRGHRVRLQVSSGAHPLFARNTGSGERLKGATRLRVADLEILHDTTRRSCLRVPVTRL